MIDNQLGKNDKDKKVHLKGQDLFSKLITIKIGLFRDEDVVWIGVHNCPVIDIKIQLLVAEARWLETWLWGTLVNWRCVDVTSVFVLVRTVVAQKLWWCRSPLLGEAGAGLQLVQLLVGAGLAAGLSWSRSARVDCWKVQERLLGKAGDVKV